MSTTILAGGFWNRCMRALLRYHWSVLAFRFNDNTRSRFLFGVNRSDCFEPIFSWVEE